MHSFDGKQILFCVFLVCKNYFSSRIRTFQKKFILGKLQFRDIPFNGKKANQFSLMNTTLKLCTIHFQIFVIFNILCPSFMKVLHVFTLNSIEHTEWPPKKTQVQGNPPPARWSDRKKLDVLHTAAFMLQ